MTDFRPKYQAYLKKRKEIFGDKYNDDLKNLSLEELYEKKEMGEEWLKTHETHKQYLSQLRRYEMVCDLITEQST